MWTCSIAPLPVWLVFLIIGIKDATGDLVRGQELLNLVGDKMAVYSGDDGTAYELILMGAKGNISVTANVAPKAMSVVCEASRQCRVG